MVTVGSLKCEPRAEEKLGRFQMERFIVVVVLRFKRKCFLGVERQIGSQLHKHSSCVLHKAIQDLRFFERVLEVFVDPRKLPTT